MNSDPVDLRRVRWFDGLFLKPGHFQRQDAFAESLALWNARYASSLFGIIGAGPRAASNPTDAFSPARLTALRLETATAVSVGQIRGLTPGGAWIDLQETLQGNLPSLDPDEEALVYVVRRRAAGGFAVRSLGDHDMAGNAIDLADAHYELTIRPTADDAAWALVVGRLRRRGDVVERDDSFVPASAFVSSHAALADLSGDLQSRIDRLHYGFVEAHNRLREIAALARRAAVPTSDDYDDLILATRHISEIVGECAHAMSRPHLPVQVFLDALARLADGAERTMNLTPSLVDYLKRTELATAWTDIRKRLLEPLRPEENLVDRVAAGRSLVSALDGVRERIDERCQDYRLMRRYRDLDLAVDHLTQPKTLFVRVSDPVAVEGVSHDTRFRLTGLTLAPTRTYIAILFGAGDAPLGNNDYSAVVHVNENEQQPDIAGAGRRMARQSNLAVPVAAHGDVIRDVRITLKNGGPFSAAALYVKAHAGTTRFVVSDSPEVIVNSPPEYVVLQLTGHKSDREKKVATIGSRQVRVRMSYDRSEDKGGKGSRRMFEVIMTKGQVWSLSLADSERKDARFVCRWNDSDSLSSQRGIYDFPELPRSLQVGIPDAGKVTTWLFRCRFKHLREERDGTVEESVAAKLEEISPAWPLK